MAASLFFNSFSFFLLSIFLQSFLVYGHHSLLPRSFSLLPLLSPKNKHSPHPFITIFRQKPVVFLLPVIIKNATLQEAKTQNTPKIPLLMLVVDAALSHVNQIHIGTKKQCICVYLCERGKHRAQCVSRCSSLHPKDAFEREKQTAGSCECGGDKYCMWFLGHLDGDAEQVERDVMFLCS